MFRRVKSSALLVMCTCPDTSTAERIAGVLVENGLAACVNLLPGASSVYRWQGRVERTTETLMVIKTTSPGYPALEERLAQEHPYDVPEIVALDITAGLTPYLDWIDSCVN
jgi:periplasmic divalent cation tolerance protein